MTARRGRAAHLHRVGHRSVYWAAPDRPHPQACGSVNAITAEGLVKVYQSRKNEVRALDGLDLDVAEGHRPRACSGRTAPARRRRSGSSPRSSSRTRATRRSPGFDVVTQAQQLRPVIGLSGQYAAVDENLTGRENLWMFGRLYQLPSTEAAAPRRTSCSSSSSWPTPAIASSRPIRAACAAGSTSASALIGRPRLLFLDEPTTGLDPRSRLGMWDVIRGLVREGTTLLLTTQYLEEADELADTIAVVDHGKIIARGTADELKAQVGGERIEVVVRDRGDDRDARARSCARDCERRGRRSTSTPAS